MSAAIDGIRKASNNLRMAIAEQGELHRTLWAAELEIKALRRFYDADRAYSAVPPGETNEALRRELQEAREGVEALDRL